MSLLALATLIGLEILLLDPNYLGAARTGGLFAFLYGVALAARGVVMVTNRRLVRRSGLFLGRLQEVRLGEIEAIEGSSPESMKPVRVLRTDGTFVDLDLFPEAERIRSLLAEAAGFPAPNALLSISLRAGRFLVFATKLVGPLSGLFLAWLLLALWLGPLDREYELYFVFFGLVPAILPGVLLGWLLGAFVALMVLRSILTFEEVRSAIYADLRVKLWGKQTLLRIAGLLYGRFDSIEYDQGSEIIRH